MTNSPERIVSFLPSATEMLYALGAGERVVGVTHECDFPSAARTKPAVVRPTLDLAQMTASEIDQAVSGQLSSGASIYNVDTELLRELRPDLIVTQDLCAVCAPAQADITAAITQLSPAPRVLSLTPHSLGDVLDNIREVGAAIGAVAEADAIASNARARISRLRETTAPLPRPRVFCMEWTDPVYCSGHWVAEMVQIAGGIDRLVRDGTDSVRIDWTEVLEFAPEVLVVMPCGYDLAHAKQQAESLRQMPHWSSVPAVRDRRVFVVDANSYFARPGPRLIDGIELLAHLLHPTECGWSGDAAAFARFS